MMKNNPHKSVGRYHVRTNGSVDDPIAVYDRYAITLYEKYKFSLAEPLLIYHEKFSPGIAGKQFNRLSV